MSIYLSSNIDSGDISMIEDIVFARYDTKNKLIDWFALHTILVEGVSVTFDEIPIPQPGGEAGEMIFDLSAEILLFQNSSFDARMIQGHGNHLWQVHILFTNGHALSSVAIDTAGNRAALAKNNTMLTKYNNVGTFRDEFGLYLRITDTATSDRQIHIVGKGSTCEKVNWIPANKKDFYKRFPEAAAGITQTFGANGAFEKLVEKSTVSSAASAAALPSTGA